MEWTTQFLGIYKADRAGGGGCRLLWNKGSVLNSPTVRIKQKLHCFHIVKWPTLLLPNSERIPGCQHLPSIKRTGGGWNWGKATSTHDLLKHKAHISTDPLESSLNDVTTTCLVEGNMIHYVFWVHLRGGQRYSLTDFAFQLTISLPRSHAYLSPLI